MLLGMGAFFVAFISGVVALIKFYTRKKPKYFFVGLGLIGASVFDFIFMILKNIGEGTGIVSLNPSALFLSVVLFASLVFGYILRDLKPGWVKPGFLFQISAVVFCFLLGVFLWYFQFPKNTLLVISGLFFLFSFIGYYHKGTWNIKYFEQLLVTSLIILFLSQVLFLNFSQNQNDALYLASDAMRIFAYGLILVGLLMSTYNAFKVLEEYGLKSEARLAASIDSLPLGYILTDEKDKIISTNKEAFLIFDEKDNEKLKSKIEKKLKLKERFGKFKLKELESVQDEISFNGRYLKVYFNPVYNNGKASGYVVLVQDTTEAKQSDRTKNEFIALASHELRTPLGAIRGNIELLSQMYPLAKKDEKVKEIMDDIYNSSLRLINIVGDFLDVYALEQKRVVFKKENFFLEGLLKEVAVSFSTDARRKGIILSVERTEKDLSVVADREKTKQVLINLLGNALKFTQKGKISLSAVKKGDFAEVLVSDTGRGIEKKSRGILFEKFRQVGDDFLKHDSTQGAGLGLYISRMLVTKMKGDIYLVKSVKGKGSVFAFTLPLSGG